MIPRSCTLFLFVTNSWVLSAWFPKNSPGVWNRAMVASPILLIHNFWTCWPASGKPGLNERNGICICLREKWLWPGFSLPREAASGRAEWPVAECTCAPNSPQTCSAQKEGGAEGSKGEIQRVGGWEELGTEVGAGIALHSYGGTAENQTYQVLLLIDHPVIMMLNPPVHVCQIHTEISRS